MTTDTTPTTRTRKPTKAQQAKTEQAAQARAAQARAEQNAKARHGLRFLIRSITQGEWLAICRGLDMTRAGIADDDSLTMLAAAYVKDKRENGVSSWEVLLEMTDLDLMRFHGFDVGALEEGAPDDPPAVD